MLVDGDGNRVDRDGNRLDERGYSTKQHVKCEVCCTIWDRGPNFHGLDIGTQALDYVAPIPCTGCGRHPGKNTPVSCAGCAGEDARCQIANVHGYVTHLCHGCFEGRARTVAKEVPERATAAAPDHALVTPEQYATREGIGRSVARATLVRRIMSVDVTPERARELADAGFVSRMGPIRNDDPPAPMAAVFKRHWAFDLRLLAQTIFVTDPRVQAIINRVTDTKPPRFSKKARIAREKEEHPLMVWSSDKALGPNELEEAIESLRGNSVAHIMPAEQGKLEVIGPTNTPRQRRTRAAELAWKNEHGGKVERAARHDAIRRAVAIVRAVGDVPYEVHRRGRRHQDAVKANGGKDIT